MEKEQNFGDDVERVVASDETGIEQPKSIYEAIDGAKQWLKMRGIDVEISTDEEKYFSSRDKELIVSLLSRVQNFLVKVDAIKRENNYDLKYKVVLESAPSNSILSQIVRLRIGEDQDDLSGTMSSVAHAFGSGKVESHKFNEEMRRLKTEKFVTKNKAKIEVQTIGPNGGRRDTNTFHLLDDGTLYYINGYHETYQELGIDDEKLTEVLRSANKKRSLLINAVNFDKNLPILLVSLPLDSTLSSGPFFLPFPPFMIK